MQDIKAIKANTARILPCVMNTNVVDADTIATHNNNQIKNDKILDFIS
jgi:hypothetical protein